MKNLKAFENFLENDQKDQIDFIEDNKVVCPDCSSDNVDILLKGQCECITCGNTFTINENLKSDVEKLKNDTEKITKNMDLDLLEDDHAYSAYDDLTKAKHIIAKAQKSISRIKKFESFDHPDAFEHGMDSSKIEKIIRAAETKGLIELADQFEYLKTQVDDLESFMTAALREITNVLGYDKDSAEQLLNELENYDIDRLDDDHSIADDISESVHGLYDKDFLEFNSKDISKMLKDLVTGFETGKIEDPKYVPGTMTYNMPVGNDGHYNIDLEMTMHPSGSKDIFPRSKKTIYSLDFRFMEPHTEWNTTQPIIKVYSLNDLNSKQLVEDILKYIDGKRKFKKNYLKESFKKVNESFKNDLLALHDQVKGTVLTLKDASKEIVKINKNEKGKSLSYKTGERIGYDINSAVELLEISLDNIKKLEKIIKDQK